MKPATRLVEQARQGEDTLAALLVHNNKMSAYPDVKDKVTLADLAQKKRRGQKITALTAYDYPTALLVDGSGVDITLVGDSLGMEELGYDTTVPVTMEIMLHHTKAVRRGTRRALAAWPTCRSSPTR